MRHSRRPDAPASPRLDADWLRMDGMPRFDVAIVGGGPAGARAAFRLASGGARVALVDPSHPREKPCGGGVTGRALELVGAESAVAAEDGVSIRELRFEHRDRDITIPLDADGEPPRLAVFSRLVFDRHLLDLARSAGATLIPARAVDVTRTNTGWTVMTREEAVSSRWIIGADGPGSLVRRRVSAPFARGDLSIAAGHYVHGVSARRIDIAFADDPPGYLWSFPRPDHLAVGVCAQADVTTPARLLALSERWIDDHVEGGVRERYSWPIPSLTAAALDRERPAGDGWMLAGDAAGLVDPITREGIYFALASGDHAAESILGAADPSAAYHVRLRDTIYTELMLAARLQARFFRPSFCGLLVSALQRSARIRAIMADLVAGEQPYHSLRRRLLRTFELRLMLELFGGFAQRT